MSKDMNIIIIIGRLVRDPEIRYTTSGIPVVRFSIANGNKFKENGQWVDYTNYFDVVAFGNQATNCEKYIKKGSQISVKGSLKQQRWTDKNTNQNRSKIEISAESIQFLSHINNENNENNNAKSKKSEPMLYEENNDPWGNSSTMPDNLDHLNNDDDCPF